MGGEPVVDCVADGEAVLGWEGGVDCELLWRWVSVGRIS